MGTNYYLVKKKPSLYGGALHIGKSSLGWKFLFHGYQDYEYRYNEPHININSIDDWKNFLKNDEFVILDEYDEEVSYDEFFEMVERKQEEENPDNFKHCANIGGYRFTFNDFG